MKTKDFNNWYDKNREVLIDTFINENEDLFIYDEDYSNVEDMINFQNFVDERFNEVV
jgi:hypothetical protein